MKTIICKKDMFEKLWSCRGSFFIANSEEDSAFLYSAVGAGNWIGLYRLSIPEIPDIALQNWEHFGYWLDEITPVPLKLKGIAEEMGYTESAPRPLEYFGVKGQISLEVISATHGLDGLGVYGVVVDREDRSLLLIYEDHDAWVLGHADRVLVVENQEDLTKSGEFFPLSYGQK